MPSRWPVCYVSTSSNPSGSPPRINASSSNASPRHLKIPSSGRPTSKLQLKSLFQHWGLFPTGTCVYSKHGRVAWLKQLPHDPLRAQALLLYELLDQALAGQSQFRRLMCQTGRQFPEIQRLGTTPASVSSGLISLSPMSKTQNGSLNSPDSLAVSARHPRPH